MGHKKYALNIHKSNKFPVMPPRLSKCHKIFTILISDQRNYAKEMRDIKPLINISFQNMFPKSNWPGVPLSPFITQMELAFSNLSSFTTIYPQN